MESELKSKTWNTDYLDAQREIGDEPADRVIAAVVRNHAIAKVDEMFRSLVRNDGIVPEHMPPEVHAFLDETAALPEWAEPDLIARGENFFDLHWPLIVTFLFCGSLPNAYAAHRGAQVLFLTARLKTQVERRIFETAQFVLDVMAEGGIGPAGHGVRTAQKVRLMHASIRQFILHDPIWQEQWDPEWGVPINQEDLAGTLMTFSIQILDGFKRFRIPVSAEEAEAYLHVWKVIGHVMGVREELIPADVADGYELAYAILDHQKGSSTAGIELTAALLAFMEGKIPVRILRGLPAAMMRRCIDADVADMLAIPRANWTRALVALVDWFLRIGVALVPDSRRVHPLLDRMATDIVQALIDLDRGGERTPFSIPESLRAPI
jgi:hypothetical protein